jgi:nucleoside-diphosphate-sugar epimerase
MIIFVTGASGSIGAHLVKTLSEQGHTVHVLLRTLKHVEKLKFKNVIFFKGDITQKDTVQMAMKGCEQVYHLAAFAGVWDKDKNKYRDTNVQGTLNILEAAVDLNIQKVVVTSTAGVLGPSIKSVVNEKTEVYRACYSAYEDSKWEAEQLVKAFVKEKQLDAVIVSPSRVYGPFLFGEPSSITLLMNKYVNGSWRFYPGTGREVGNYIFLKDVVQGHLLAMEKGRTGETYILGGINCNYISFYECLTQVSGIKRKMLVVPFWIQKWIANLYYLRAVIFGIQPAITPIWLSRAKYNWELDCSKAINELGLKTTPLEIGMKETVKYLRQLEYKK